MNKIIKLSILSLVILASSFSLNAQKFGYVDSQSIIQTMPSVKEANSSIEIFRNQLQKKGEAMIKSLQTKYENLRKLQNTIAPVELEKKAQALKLEEQKIAEFDQSSQQKIFEKSESILRPIREKLQKAIQDVATQEGYTYIFDYSQGFVLYADKSMDISSKVKAKLGL